MKSACHSGSFNDGEGAIKEMFNFFFPLENRFELILLELFNTNLIQPIEDDI